MSKSQARRLREATKRFGRENRGRWHLARTILSILIRQRKKDAGLVAPTVIGPVSTGPIVVKRYSTYLSHRQNEAVYGRSSK